MPGAASLRLSISLLLIEYKGQAVHPRDTMFDDRPPKMLPLCVPYSDRQRPQRSPCALGSRMLAVYALGRGTCRLSSQQLRLWL